MGLMASTEAKQPCYTGGSKPSHVCGWGDFNAAPMAQGLRRRWQRPRRALACRPEEVGIIEVGIGLGAFVVYVLFWVAIALLLHRLAS
jgi:hypothetical protein